MHYTSIENIHKVIDPLFLNGIKEEFERIKNVSNPKERNNQLDIFQRKISKLKFFDPACGSGNFLTETYLSLRKIENEIIKQKFKGQMVFDVDGVIQISIGQFYGIELNDYAVTVAKTALWIAESQMMKETEKIVATDLNFLPLKSYANIVEGNSLRLDWADVVPKGELNYIMGNPPFLGYTQQSKEQKEDLDLIFKGRKGSGVLDYVTAWYQKAAEYIQGTKIEVAYVSTNSITQGEQVAVLWKHLMNELGVVINFGYRTFKWDNEAKGKAAVHCVIIGFDAKGGRSLKFIFAEDGKKTFAQNINGYLVNAPTIFIEKRTSSISNQPKMIRGSQPTDDGNFLFDEDEVEVFLEKEPQAKPYIKRFMMGNEFINNIPRYCLWLVNCPPNELRKMPFTLERVNRIKTFRENSKKEATRKKASTPTLFDEIKQPNSNFVAIPVVSSERRDYIPSISLFLFPITRFLSSQHRRGQGRRWISPAYRLS
ncbi:DNA methyltransferase [Methanocorpusculum sp.]